MKLIWGVPGKIVTLWQFMNTKNKNKTEQTQKTKQNSEARIDHRRKNNI